MNIDGTEDELHCIKEGGAAVDESEAITRDTAGLATPGRCRE